MARLVRCVRCRATFDAERFVTHVADGGCRPPGLPIPVVVVACVSTVAAFAGLLELAEAANADPGGVASWARFVVACVIAAIGTALVRAEMRRETRP